MLECEAGQAYWPAEMHEPLVIGICFPFLAQRPWQSRGAPTFSSIERLLRGVWRNKEKRATSVLKSLCANAVRLTKVNQDRLDFLLTACASDFLAFRKNKKRKHDDITPLFETVACSETACA